MARVVILRDDYTAWHNRIVEQLGILQRAQFAVVHIRQREPLNERINVIERDRGHVVAHACRCVVVHRYLLGGRNRISRMFAAAFVAAMISGFWACAAISALNTPRDTGLTLSQMVTALTRRPSYSAM